MNETLFQALTLIVPLVVAIVFHEVAHGWTARMLGDPTAAQLGRLSLNPIRHVDPFGTIILPMLLSISGAPVFGWAKPVPVNFGRLRNRRWGMVLVAIAGPASNILLVGVTLAVLALVPSLLLGTGKGAAMTFAAASISAFISINLFLAVFNMIPLPPFDGSKVLAGFLPEELRTQFLSLDRYALLLMIGLIVLLPMLGPQFDVIGKLVVPPVRWLLEQAGYLLSLAYR